ncbi:MAG: serine/threonine-protein kinase [Tepidisphaeraceae bacterium]|jgi:tRNA A-37 threonylcarbamoyl transferase component Bud32
MIIVCPSDEELLAVASGDAPSSDLQSHLQECNRCVRRVDGLRLEVKELQKVFASTEHDPNPSPTPNVHRAPASEAQTTSAEPKMIGKYLLVGTLGGGGQASVYRAVHPTLDEQVVIKLSSRTLDEGDSAKNDRLIAEGRILCQLKHPNIGRVYDMDFYERRPYLVMEYVRGRALDQYVRDRSLSWQEIAALVAKVARTLGAAHRLGIVHQDVKPQNIVIDESDEPKLIDFGMARLNGAWTDDRYQPLGGTINYMAPEQARSDARRITGRSDVFALGAVLYFLITRVPPYTGATREESLAKASNCQFDRESLDKAEAPARLKQIAIKAMSASPEDRFASAEEMAESLESLDRARRRRRWLVRALPVVMVLAAAGATWWWWPRSAPMPPGGQFLITPDGQSSLDGNLPLVTGEKLKIEGRVPRDSPTIVFWVGSGGQVFRMPVAQVHDPDQFDHVFSPDKNSATALSGPAGTEFLLMVSGRDLGDPKKAEALQSQLQAYFADHALAELPPTGAVLVDSTGVRARFLDGGQRSRDPGGESADSCAGVSTPLDGLSRQLKDRGYFFVGIAVAHQDRPQ